ncbi:MAG: AAA family ATPase, partial [Bacteroidota bacterium]|nr:AAA family ATPase [Bacteroidota bacterium]
IYNGSDEFPQPRGTLQILLEQNQTSSWKFADNYYKRVSKKKKMNNIIDVLKNKHQIILQGAPGTGKTRLAEIIAKELTKPKRITNTNEKIEDFFKNFNPTEEIIEYNNNVQNALDKFQNLFPISKLKDLTLNEYCAGKGDRNNFSWWIETGLKYLGKYSPGSARSYLIYWSKQKEDYSLHGKLIKEITEPTEAMHILSNLIYTVVSEKSPEKGSEFLGNGYILKLLNSYYPNEFFPINSEKNLDFTLQLLSENPKELSVFEKNKLLSKIFSEKKKKYNSNVSPFDFMRFLYGNFNIREGENIKENQTIEIKGETCFVQFHPAYSYEDFVRGIITETTEEGQVVYSIQNKILAEFADKAINNPKAYYVLIIDEINRANLPAVLGELIYALEYRGKSVESMYEYENSREIILPENLLIIGTMNTADRSVGNIDYAIRRRFAFITLFSDKTVVENYYENDKLRNYATQLFGKVEKLFDKENLSPDYKKDDIMIGHSYFLATDKDNLKIKLEYEIKPILLEYVKDGIFVADNIEQKIKEL